MKPVVKNEPPKVAAPQILADAIVKVSNAADLLLRSELTEKALLILLSHSSGVPQKTVKIVLQSARDLAKDYVRR